MADALIARFTKRFQAGPTIAGELSLPVTRHSITVLFGPSGCGKTTVLRCLAGLEQPEDGTILFGSETWFDARRKVCLEPQQRRIGFVFQDYALFPHLSVADNIAHGLREVSAAGRARLVEDSLARFGLKALAQRRPRELSGGQQQRVALARSLARRPRLLLMDEPFAALDASAREQLRAELRSLLGACGIPVLLVTHDRIEALALGDQVLVMDAGAALQMGPVLDVFNRPANADVARIVGMETLQPGTILSVKEGLAAVAVGRVTMMALAPASATCEVFVCIRGEEVILQLDPGSPSSVRNRLPARVVALQPEGPLARVELDAGFRLFALVTRPACAELDLREGLAVTALIKTPAVHLIPRNPA